MCSNGYSHQQPCPPGTKTSGSPSYKAGYYYGYTDLCSVNLVDYGLGPEHYAPVGYSRVATKDAVKEVHQHGTGHGSELYAEKEVVTSYNQRPLGHHGNSHHGNSHNVNSHHGNSHHVNSHQQHVVKVEYRILLFKLWQNMMSIRFIRQKELTWQKPHLFTIGERNWKKEVCRKNISPNILLKLQKQAESY